MSCQLGSAGQDIRNLIKAAFYASPRDFFLSASSDPHQCTMAWGRQLPSFLSALCSLIGGAEKSHYKRVELITRAPPHPRQDHMCLGPHCQCSFLAGQEQSRDPQHVVVPISGPAGSRPGGTARAAHVRLPAWVVNSPPGAVTPHGGSCGVLGPVGHALAAVTPAPLRFHWRSCNAPNAVGVDQTGKFRARIRSNKDGHTSRCVLPESVPLVFADLDDALQAAGNFLNALAAEEDAVFGQEGTNAGMARALRAMCACFDWGRLVGDGLVPTKDDLEEFLVLARLLEPYLQYTEWPSKEVFPEVVHGWPDSRELQVQYVVLMNRLRTAASMPRFRSSWWSVTGYYVEPLLTFPSVLRLVRRIYGSGAHALEARRQGLCRIAAVVSSMLGRGIADQVARTAPDALAAPSAFFISTRLLARCGVPWQNRKRPHQLRRSVKEAWAFQLGLGNGSVGVLLLPGRIGRLVHVTRTVRELDWSAVSASVDGDPFFSAGNVQESPVAVHNARGAQRPRSAWHAVRIHHQCRPMGSPEACCERVGSLMQHRWFKRRHPDPGTLMDGVLLQDAQVACIGGERDEALCRDVVKSLMASGRHPFVASKDCKRRRRREGINHSRSLQNLRDDLQRALEASGRLPHGPGGPGADDSEISESSGDSGQGGVRLGGSKTVRPCGHRGSASTQNGLAPADLGIQRPGDVSDMRQERRAKSMPAMQLSAKVAKVLQKVVDDGGGVAAQPVFMQDPRTATKRRANSTVRGEYARWLDTPDGRHYLEERAALATGDAHRRRPGGRAAKSASSKG